MMTHKTSYSSFKQKKKTSYTSFTVTKVFFFKYEGSLALLVEYDI